eukprot:7382001-Prymnesium_polylepis.2
MAAAAVGAVAAVTARQSQACLSGAAQVEHLHDSLVRLASARSLAPHVFEERPGRLAEQRARAAAFLIDRVRRARNLAHHFARVHVDLPVFPPLRADRLEVVVHDGRSLLLRVNHFR